MTTTADAEMSTVAELTGFLIHRLGLDSLAADTDIFAAGLVNSLFAVELVTHLENMYGFEVEPDDLVPANFLSVNALARLVLQKTNHRAAA